MVTAPTRRDLFWGYVAQFLNAGAGLMLLPVIVRYLSPEDVGLWFVFITLASLAQLIEFGFQPTLARNSAYVYAGAQSLAVEGLPLINRNRESEPINLKLLADLVAAARTIYRRVAALAILGLLGGGTGYILTLLTPQQDLHKTLLAWMVFALGYIATFYYGYFNGLLQGRGDITGANQVTAITRATLVISGLLAVVMGFGLLGLGLASLFSCIVGRWIAIRLFYSSNRPESMVIRTINSQSGVLIKTLWHNTSRLGAVHVGAFLIQRANILIASSFLGLATAASYGMTITVLMALSSLAIVFCQVQLPHMNTLQANGERQELRGVYGGVMIIAWIIFILGLLGLLLLGDWLLSAIGSRTTLLHTIPLATIGLIMLLELNHSIAATFLTTTNRIPFVGAALWSGASIVLLSLTLISFWGIWALITAQGFVQLAYNNWKWPIEAIRYLGGNVMGIFFDGVRNIARQLSSR